MVSSVILNNKININLEAKSTDLAATLKGNGSNFFLDAHPSDIANYMREGNDLNIELNNGSQLTIHDFFANGLDFNNLILKDDNILEWVNFSKSLENAGDHINELAVIYDPIADSGATAALLGILGAAAVGGNVAAAAHSKNKDSANRAGSGGSTDTGNGSATDNDNSTGTGNGSGNATDSGNCGNTPNNSEPTLSVITSIGPDSGASNSDFITNEPNITINGTLSHAPNEQEKVQVRIDGGEWQEVELAGTSWSYDNKTLSWEMANTSLKPASLMQQMEQPSPQQKNNYHHHSRA